MKTTASFFCAVLIGVAMFIAIVCLLAWPIMLIWGALGEYFEFRTIPYSIAILITCGLAMLGTFINGSKK